MPDFNATVEVLVKSEISSSTEVKGLGVHLSDIDENDAKVLAVAHLFKAVFGEVFGREEYAITISIDHLSGAAVDRNLLR